MFTLPTTLRQVATEKPGNPVLQRDTAAFPSDSNVLAAGVLTGTRESETSEMLSPLP